MDVVIGMGNRYVDLSAHHHALGRLTAMNIQVDFLTWLMDAAEGPEFETSALTNRVLLLNSVSFDTTSMVCLFCIVVGLGNYSRFHDCRLSFKRSIT